MAWSFADAGLCYVFTGDIIYNNDTYINVDISISGQGGVQVQILIKKDNFSTVCYDLQVGDTALRFIGKDDSFVLPYPELRDFCITQDRRDKAYFSMQGEGKMYEGQIREPKEIEPFTSALKEMLGGVINIEVSR